MLPPHRHYIPIAISLFIASVPTGCKPESPKLDSGTEEDTGIFAPNVDLAGEAGGEEQPLPTGECIQEPDGRFYGYWHQCDGWIEISFDAEYNGHGYTGTDILNFGAGQKNPDYWTEPDSYDLPLVAACCGPFDYENPTTEEKIPYVNNCLFDAVEQICVGSRTIPQTASGVSGKAVRLDPTAMQSINSRERFGCRRIHQPHSGLRTARSTTGQPSATCRI